MLLIMFEEVNEGLDQNEKNQNFRQTKRLLGTTQQPALRARVEKCVALVGSESHENI